MKIISVMREISKEINKSMASVAIRWILDHIHKSSVICGIKNERQLLLNLEAMGWNLSQQHLELLDRVSGNA